MKYVHMVTIKSSQDQETMLVDVHEMEFDEPSRIPVGPLECPLFHHILTLPICQIPAPFIIPHIHFPQITAEYTFYARGLLFLFS